MRDPRLDYNAHPFAYRFDGKHWVPTTPTIHFDTSEELPMINGSATDTAPVETLDTTESLPEMVRDALAACTPRFWTPATDPDAHVGTLLLRDGDGHVSLAIRATMEAGIHTVVYGTVKGRRAKAVTRLAYARVLSQLALPRATGVLRVLITLPTAMYVVDIMPPDPCDPTAS